MRANGPTSTLALLLALLLVPQLSAAQGSRVATGTVLRVIDGDTIHVRVGNKVERVRYIGVSAPELDQPGGREATEANRKLVATQSVRLELDAQERDRHGRLLAYVYVGDMMVNAELLAQGWVLLLTLPPNVRHQELLSRSQHEARLLQAGLWKDTGAAPPPPGGAALARVSRPGVDPSDSWNCPSTHPIKGNFTTYSGERCIHHSPGGAFYGKTKPERCYISGEEAIQDGCRASRR